mgnify:CR=1 FL=1
MSRSVEVPDFIREVFEDPRRRGVLFAGVLALFAVGLVPRALSPGLPSSQELLRVQPEVQNLFLLLAFTSTATIILGGLVSDIYRRRSLLVGGLMVMAGGCGLSVFFDHGALFYLGNYGAVAASGVVLAYGIGSVAIAYQGIPRATALGFVYAAFGAGAAVSPAVLTLFPTLLPSSDASVPAMFSFDTTLAYVLPTIASLVALWAAYRYVPMIPGTLPARPLLVAGVAFWSLSMLALVSGLLGLLGPASQLLPLVLLASGAIGTVALSAAFSRRSSAMGNLVLDRRAIVAALVVGVTIGFAQAVPLMLLPIVFEYPLHYGTLFAILALIPFGLALVAAGPITGILIQRFGPRGIMAGGTLALGLANLAMALILAGIAGAVRDFYAANPGTARVDLGVAHYALFVIPLLLIGAGFVLATTVRTAIVFATTPRGLPASAAAINEASVSLGSRVGIVIATTVVSITALASARAFTVDRPAAESEAMVAEFESILTTLGTPAFRGWFEAVFDRSAPAQLAAYAVSYVDGVTAALLLSGIVALVGAALAWFLIGRRNPMNTVFDMQEERQGGIDG